MIGIGIALFLLLGSAAVAGWRMLVGPGEADRALASDLFFFTVIGLIALFGLITGVEEVLDLVLMGAVLGLLATLSMARALMNGRR